MSWDEQLFAVFDDLEQQAQGAFAVERALEVTERAAAEYAGVTLSGRLMASVGHEVVLGVDGLGPVAGSLRRVASGWCLVLGAGQEWILPLPAVAWARGLSERAVPEAAWPAAASLGLGSALRRLAEAGESCRLALRDGSTYDVRPVRVGADFVEAVVGARPEPLVVGFGAIAAVVRRTT